MPDRDAAGPTVLWFRRDLRLSDHPALLAAVDATVGRQVVALFTVDDALWRPAGANRRAFLRGCLGALDDSLGGRLVVRHGDPVVEVPRAAAEAGASEVYITEDFGPVGRARDAAVDRSLRGDGRSLVRVGSPYAVAPGQVRTRKGEPFRVFTPFARAWRDHGWPAPGRAPANVDWLALRSDGLPSAAPEAASLPPPGEVAAKSAARRFWEAGLDGYDACRDRPDLDATSRLSPYLRWGCLHPRQLLAKLGTSQPHQTFRTELCWREFYADVLFHQPASARSSLDPRMRVMEVDPADPADGFVEWCEGRTGFPIVDAGMRQLRAEGWMHNRVRMLTASFLVKDLHLDWSRGARWFMRHLVDGDLASNQHGWQWVAGTGTDAAPYFRVFNPVVQGERFDPTGAYVRRWVPELEGVADRYVHKPWADPAGSPAGYPPPMVDHAEERAEALRRYGAVRGRA